MPKVILLCGKICCGKSTYAEKLRGEENAVLLSTDEIMLAVFEQCVGEKHDYYVERIQTYLLEKSLEVLESGVNVILDWGFWTREKRALAKDFYRLRNVPCELHLIDVDHSEWLRRVEKRNKLVSAGEVDAYFVDENLAKKFVSLFEPPDESEIDVTIKA